MCGRKEGVWAVGQGSESSRAGTVGTGVSLSAGVSSHQALLHYTGHTGDHSVVLPVTSLVTSVAN